MTKYFNQLNGPKKQMQGKNLNLSDFLFTKISSFSLVDYSKATKKLGWAVFINLKSFS